MTAPLNYKIVSGDDQAGLSLLSTLHENVFTLLGEKGWSADEFRQIVEMPGAVAVLAHDGDTPVSFAVWRAVLDEAELITIGVDPVRRRQGHAMATMNAMLENLRDSAVLKLFLEVRADNVGAIALYHALGFEEVGKRRQYYQTHSGNRVDALCLMLILNNPHCAK